MEKGIRNYMQGLAKKADSCLFYGSIGTSTIFGTAMGVYWFLEGIGIVLIGNGGIDMSVICFDPTSTSGPDGYINYKLSGGDSGGNGGGGHGPGCGIWGWIFIILLVLEIISKLS